MVDYSAPLATVTSLSYVCSPLLNSTDSTFAVHAFDQVNQMEEANSDARIRLILDNQGSDVTAQPIAVEAVRLVPSLGGGGRVSWTFISSRRADPPTNFLINLYRGQTTIATGNIPFKPAQIGYSFLFPGTLSPAVYTVWVIAVGTGGLRSSPALVSTTLGLSSDAFVMDSLNIH